MLGPMLETSQASFSAVSLTTMTWPSLPVGNRPKHTESSTLGCYFVLTLKSKLIHFEVISTLRICGDTIRQTSLTDERYVKVRNRWE